MTIVLLAALCMVVQDVVAVVMVQAENRSRGWLAGILDAFAWAFGIATTALSVTVLQGHHTAIKVAVIAAVSVANVLGSKLGQVLGDRLVKPKPHPLEAVLVHLWADHHGITLDAAQRAVDAIQQEAACHSRP